MAINFTDSPADGATQVIGGRTYIYNSAKNKWDTTATEVTGPTATVYANVDALPTSENITGAQAYVSGNNRLYIWNGTGWYNIALINTAPTISGVSSSYALADDGTATTVTITASDPEGLPITYSIASDTSGNIATVTQSNNVFTITPTTDTANAGTFSLTFRASDGINLATAVAEFTLIFSVSNSNYTTALITTNGGTGTNSTFTDSSTSSHTFTVSGNVNQTSFSPYRSGGYSAYFDGSGDYLNIPYNATLVDWSSGDFTIEAWVYYNSFNVGAAGTPLIVRHGAAGTSTNYWSFGAKSTGALQFYYYNGAAVSTCVSTDTLSLNQWHHIAMSYNNNNNEITLYLDGVSVHTHTVSGTPQTNTGSTLVIGELQGTEHNGYITDLRITGSEVYSSAFTPTVERLTAITNTHLLACHLPYFADGSTNNHTVTPNGDVATKPFGPYDYRKYAVGNHGGSAYFDSSSSYLSTPDSDDWYLDGDFTIEFWFYKENSGTFQVPFSQRQGSTSELRLVLDWSSGDVFTPGNIMLEWHAVQILVSGAGVRNEAWNHLVIQRSGTSVYMYLNGYMVHGAAQPSALSNYSAALTIGSYGTNAYDIKGNLTDFRWVKGTAVYSISGTVGNKLFTPPTEPLTAITDTKLLLSMQGAVILDKSQTKSNLTLANGLTASTTQYKYLSSSMDFTQSLAETYFQSDTNLFTKDFTLEAWIWSADIDHGGTDNVSIFDWRPTSSASGNYGLLWIVAGTSTLGWWVNGSYRITGNTTLSDNTWHHIAVSREGSTHRMFIDGTLQTQTWTDSNTYLVPTNRPVIGNSGYHRNATQHDFHGYMSDIRITKGLARYTANFTPPSAALEG